jgi:hypothetical protein
MARRTRGRHGRRFRRATPRRWLPFVALLGITAGAVVVANQATGPQEASRAVDLPSTLMPVAAEPDALSTAWYCAGGTARGGDGPAELSVLIANAAGTGAQADVAVVGSDGQREATSIAVPASGQIRVNGPDLVSADWIAMTVEVLGGRATVEREVSGPDGIDVSPCSTNASARWYVPSGSTVRGASEQLMLFNPFPDATSVDISFATDEGRRTPRGVQGLSIPGRSLRVVPAGDLPARRPEVATSIVARTGRIVVDRVQVYDGTGDPVTGSADGAVDPPAPQGLASTAAVPAPSARWLFPHAVKDAGTRTQVAVYNPGPSEAEIDVVITYEQPDRFTEVEPLALTVRGGQQEVLDLSDVAEIVDGAGFTIDVRSLEGVPVVAEQLVFGAVASDPTDVPAQGEAVTEEEPIEAVPAEETPPDDDAAAAEEVASPGFAVLAGSPVAASEWLLAGRAGSDDQVATVVVANPGQAEVAVQAEEIDRGRRSLVAGATVTVPAGDRRTLDLADAGVDTALLVRADGPVVVARSAVIIDGTGIVWSLATPLPETAVRLLPGS